MYVLDFLKTFSVSIKDGNEGGRARYSLKYHIFSNLIQGFISKKHLNELENTEKLLNLFFTSLYADIKQVFYKTEPNEDKITYKLYSSKLIGNKLIDIDFKLESTGTLEILDLLPPLLTAVEGKAVIIDEFESGIHDLMIKKIMDSFSDSIKGQLILTTHNTLLIEKCIPKDSVYVITIDENGNKQVPCISDFHIRTNRNHNNIIP